MEDFRKTNGKHCYSWVSLWGSRLSFKELAFGYSINLMLTRMCEEVRLYYEASWCAMETSWPGPWWDLWLICGLRCLFSLPSSRGSISWSGMSLCAGGCQGESYDFCMCCLSYLPTCFSMVELAFLFCVPASFQGVTDDSLSQLGDAQPLPASTFCANLNLVQECLISYAPLDSLL